MSDIAKIFAAAKMDYLQDQWDIFLISQWMDFPDSTISFSRGVFVSREGCSFEDIDALNRSPGHEMRYMTIMRVFAEYLPRVSKILFDGADVNTAISALKNSKLQGVAAYKQAAYKDARERAKTRRDNISAQESKANIHRINRASSDWNTVK